MSTINKNIKSNMHRILLSLLMSYATLYIHDVQAADAAVSAAPYFESGQDPKPLAKVWRPVVNLSDEFNDKSIDLTKWQTNPVENGWVWLGRAPGLFDPSAINVDNGKLQVTVSKLPEAKVINNKTYLYQGAIIRSINPGQVGWYYETRMKANQTEMSSTFWLMSKNSNCKTKHELDIQENVGRVSPNAEKWAQNFDHIFHSNAFHRVTSCQKRIQKENSIDLDEKNSDRYFVYGAWWKSSTEVRFYLDGKYAYSITPPTEFNVPMWIQMAIETYDWNPVPKDGGLIASGTWQQRTTQYDWVRVWQLEDETYSP
ncbi:glycosyl hydrolase [Thalassotalea sp. PLHSN55]|uniref:glycosyl hydrolase n=1 Tax=Thalassotalea sp. PLHSN55 TaxID=3435888 RepID=UPI003F870B58